MMVGETYPLGYPCKGYDARFNHDWQLFGITGLPESQIQVINDLCGGWWGWRFTPGPDVYLVLSFEREEDLVQCKLCLDTTSW